MSNILKGILSQFTKESYDQYASKKDYLRTSSLMAFEASPRLFQLREAGLYPREETRPLVFGSAAHKLILEGELEFRKEFYISDVCHEKGKYEGKPYGEDTMAFRKGAYAIRQEHKKELISNGEYMLMKLMQEQLEANTDAKEILSKGAPEMVCRAEVNGVKVQVRIDWINNSITDYKTCAEMAKFEKDCRWNNKYVQTMSMYRRVVKEVTGLSMPVNFIVSEKAPPFACCVFSIPESALDYFEDVNDKALARYKEARESGVFKTGWEEARVLDLGFSNKTDSVETEIDPEFLEEHSELIESMER